MPKYQTAIEIINDVIVPQIEVNTKDIKAISKEVISNAKDFESKVTEIYNTLEAKEEVNESKMEDHKAGYMKYCEELKSEIEKLATQITSDTSTQDIGKIVDELSTKVEALESEENFEYDDQELKDSITKLNVDFSVFKEKVLTSKSVIDEINSKEGVIEASSIKGLIQTLSQISNQGGNSNVKIAAPILEILSSGTSVMQGATRLNFTNATVTYNNGTVDITTTGGSGGGDVTGPASATDGVPALFSGTTGKLLKNSTPTGTGNPVLQNNPALVLPSFAAVTVSGGILTLPTGASDTLVAKNSTDTLTNKTLTSPVIGTSQTNSYATASTVPYFDASKNLISSTVTPTELGYISGVTSAIQTQLNAKGAGTVTSVTSANSDATVATTTTTPVITIVSAPKLTTARTIGTLTGDITTAGSTFDGTANNTNATTLATVNSNVGSFGSATQVATFTVNAKGLTTAAANVTVTPAVGSITGLGTGVATALAVNVGTAGSPVVNGGALGTPSSGTVTNLTGTASININGTVGATTPTTGSFTTVTTSGNIELGNASDTTISRSSAGVIAVEGVVIPSISSTNTITNKRPQPRTASSTTASTLTPDLSSANVYYRTTQTATLTINAPIGTPVIGETIAIYVDSAGAQTLTMDTTYKVFGAAFPATTTAGKTLMITAQFNGTDWKTLWATAQ